MVTRRPLELRLSRVRDAKAPWGVFKGDDKKYFDFDQIRENIIALTDKLCGSNKNIIDDPIVDSRTHLLDLDGVFSRLSRPHDHRFARYHKNCIWRPAKEHRADHQEHGWLRNLISRSLSTVKTRRLSS